MCLRAISDKISYENSEDADFRRERKTDGALVFFVLAGAEREGDPGDCSLRRSSSAPRIVAYLGVLVREILKANLKTFRVVWGKGPDPVVRTIRTELTTRLGKMVLANSITLTPGTITLDCREDKLTVHCLTAEMAEGLNETVFETKLRRIEAILHG